MSEPAWLDAIKTAYMADQASVFLLHGPGVQSIWTLDDDTDDLPDILVKFLGRTREVVGLLAPPAALRFPGIGDRGRFDNLVSASFLLAGTHVALDEEVPEEALAKAWIAMADADTAQGYVVTGLDSIYPGHRKRVVDLAADTPPLWQWATDDRIRKANHIVLLVVRDIADVRPELAMACETISVGLPTGRAPEPESGPEAFFETTLPQPVPDTVQAEISERPGSEAPTEISAAPARSDNDDLENLADDLNSAIRAALATHGEEMRPEKVPIMAAVAQILGERTGSPGALTWALDEEGRAVATGEGADDFLALWRGDIVLDASAGMLLKKLANDIPDRVDETGLRALAKRVLKQL